MTQTKKAITPDIHDKYLKGGGLHCPFCGSHDISGGSFECEAGIAWQEVDCQECGECWQDIYTMTSIDNEYC